MKILFRSLLLTGLSLVALYGPFLTGKYAPMLFGRSTQTARTDEAMEAVRYETMELEMLTPVNARSGYGSHKHSDYPAGAGMSVVKQGQHTRADGTLNIAFNSNKTRPIILDRNYPMDHNGYPAIGKRDRYNRASVLPVGAVSYFAYHPLSKQITDPMMRQRATFFQ